MSEVADLRAQNKELKRLLGNALELLEKTRKALTREAQSRSEVKVEAVSARKSTSRGRKAAAKQQPPSKRRAAV